MASEQPLPSPPEDGVTSVRFGARSDVLAVSSWDCTLRLYDAARMETGRVVEGDAPLLACCFADADDRAVVTAAVDGAVRSVDVATGQSSLLGRHEDGAKCAALSEAAGLVFTGGWDATVRAWDPRAGRPAGAAARVPGKVFALDAAAGRVVVATSGRHVHVYDVRRLDRPEQVRESSLMHQTRCVGCFPDGTGFALGSIEGRVAIEYFDESPAAQARKYAFKCHRRDVGGVQTLFPVNALAFHPLHGTFASGGCDAVVNVWDGANKKRICRYPAYPTSVAALDFNRDGTMLAVAASYTFEEGEKEHPRDAVFVRAVADGEVRPKARR